ncbi:MAG: hypothetical protein KIS76_06740 [Pyrinomonadaceae bacterium]|nr:hypothetical protein [Pyrinomonadaceae bacterium]
MRLVPIVFVCLIFALPAAAQNGNGENAPVGVEEITLAKDDGNGEMGDEQEEFMPTDVPIHCSVLLDSIKASSVRMEIVLLKPGSASSGSKIVTVNFKTNGQHDRINFTGRPEKHWKTGNYKVDIYIDGKLSKSKEFTVISTKAGEKP